jgi:hypothetical protein
LTAAAPKSAAIVGYEMAIELQDQAGTLTIANFNLIVEAIFNTRARRKPALHD